MTGPGRADLPAPPADPLRRLAPLALLVFVGMTGFGLFIPIFPFLAQEFTASATAVTWAMGAYSLGQLIAAPAWGRLSDRIGRKPVLVLGLCGAGASYLAILPADTVLELGLARFGAGLMAGNIGAAFAAAADLATERTRARNMGVLGAAFGFGFIAGPALGAGLVGAEPGLADFHRVCLTAAVLAFAAAALALALFEDAPRRPAPAGPIKLRETFGPLRRLLAVTVLMIGAQAMMESTFGLWADARLGWGPQSVGYVLAAVGLIAALLQGGGAGPLARRYGEDAVLRAGLAILAAGFGLLAAAAGPALTVAGMVALAVGAGLATPALQSLFARDAAHEARGAVLGLSQSASALGRVLGPLLSGVIFDLGGASAPFAVGAAVVLAGLMAAPRPPKASG